MTTSILTRKGQPVEPPPFINFLFNDKRASILWLFVRIWLGSNRRSLERLLDKGGAGTGRG